MEAETRLPAGPIAAAVARRFITATLSDWQLGAMVDDVVLGGSELVTNAVLHAGGPVALRLRMSGADLLVEVADPIGPDRSPVSVRSPVDDDDPDVTRMTGRGLAVLAALADTWGVARRPLPGGADGKVVWFRLGVAPGAGHGSPAPTHAPAAAAAVPQGRQGELVDVPVRLFLENEMHLDDLLREMLLAAWARPDAARIVRLADDLQRFAERQAPVRNAAGELARRQLEHDRARMTVTVPIDGQAVAEGERFLLLLDEIELLARTGQLLTPPASPEVAGFRSWLVGELVRQSEGAPSAPCPFA